METRLVSGHPTKLQSLYILVIQHLPVDDISTTTAKRRLELLLFMTAGILYVLMGLWMIIDKKSRGIPKCITIITAIIKQSFLLL
jgi:hypothetical protein